MPFMVVALLILTELVHAVWLVRLPVLGQMADPALPVVIAVAFRRPAWGPVVGLGAGLLQDLLFGGSLGLFALPKLLVGQGAAMVGQAMLTDQPLLPWIATAAAVVGQQLVLSLVLAVTGLLPVRLADLGGPLAVQVALTLVAAWPAFAVVRLILRRPQVPRVREGFRAV